MLAPCGCCAWRCGRLRQPPDGVCSSLYVRHFAPRVNWLLAPYGSLRVRSASSQVFLLGAFGTLSRRYPSPSSQAPHAVGHQFTLRDAVPVHRMTMCCFKGVVSIPSLTSSCTTPSGRLRAHARPRWPLRYANSNRPALTSPKTRRSALGRSSPCSTAPAGRYTILVMRY